MARNKAKKGKNNSFFDCGNNSVHAVRHQGAQIVLFQFDNMNRKIFGKIKELKRMGIKGFYFVTGYESDVYSF